MKSKKVKPLVILTIMVLVLVGIGTIFYARESSKSKLKADQVNVSENLKEKDDKEEAIKTEKVEDASSKTSDKLNEDKEDKTTTKDIVKEEKNTNNSKNNSNNNNSNNTVSKSSGTNTSKNSDTTTSSNNNQSQPNNTQSSNNVTTDPYNYITGGVIDAPTKESCLAKCDAILNRHLDELMDYNSMHMDNQKSQDITNLECYPVHKPDQDGWFLNILCNSGNCNSKYK